jgi:phosphoglycolate phosphatase
MIAASSISDLAIPPAPDYQRSGGDGRAAMRTAIFDLDGTLADTGTDLMTAGNRCLAELGLPLLDPLADRSVARRGGRAMLRLGLERAGRAADEAVIDRLYPRLLHAYEAVLSDTTRLYPGVAQALAALAASGWRLGVCTQKPGYLAEELLRRLGIRPRFAALLGGDALPVRKPDPRHFTETVRRAGGDPARAVMVGDTATDSLTARAAGVPMVWVSFGHGEGDRPGPGDHLLHAYADLPALLGRLLP